MKSFIKKPLKSENCVLNSKASVDIYLSQISVTITSLNDKGCALDPLKAIVATLNVAFDTKSGYEIIHS
ncbi:MAG: hypothetical protein IKK55_00140 [Clostridia bacterium]|nr:hypothetical protein [Clostridia bacterium]